MSTRAPQEITPALTITGAGTFYFTPQEVNMQEKIGFQYQLQNPSTNLAGSIQFEFKAHSNAAWMPFQVSGSNYSHTISLASGYIQNGTNGKATFTSISPTTPGNEFVVAFSTGGTGGAETIALTTNTNTGIKTVTVTIETGVSTASNVVAAVNGDTNVNTLIVATTNTAGALVAPTSVSLAGGGAFIDVETASRFLRARAIITAGTGTIRAFLIAKS